MPQPAKHRSIRDEYVEFGPESYYQQHGAAYRNPHEPAIRSTLARCHRAWNLDLSRVLDLACGSGEVTLELRKLGAAKIDAADPYTGVAFRHRTGEDARPWSFEDIVAGAMDQRQYSLVVCSYALHLLEASRLPGVLTQLAQNSPALLILSPHKRPEIKEGWGWKLESEMYHQRVRARLFSVEA